MRPVVYLSTPMRKGRWTDNVRVASFVAAELMKLGFGVINPIGSWLPDLVVPLDADTWINNDFALIQRCDAVFRIEGESEGADKECMFAKENGIPIYFTIENIKDTFLDELL